MRAYLPRCYMLTPMQLSVVGLQKTVLIVILKDKTKCLRVYRYHIGQARSSGEVLFDPFGQCSTWHLQVVNVLTFINL